MNVLIHKNCSKFSNSEFRSFAEKKCAQKNWVFVGLRQQKTECQPFIDVCQKLQDKTPPIAIVKSGCAIQIKDKQRLRKIVENLHYSWWEKEMFRIKENQITFSSTDVSKWKRIQSDTKISFTKIDESHLILIVDELWKPHWIVMWKDCSWWIFRDILCTKEIVETRKASAQVTRALKVLL